MLTKTNIMILRLNKLFLVLLLVLNISCTQREQKAFSFVQMCDTQLGMGGYEHDLKLFQLAVKQINDLNPDFVVICGDLVNTACDSSYSDFQKIKNGFKMPCYCAPGNHDEGNIPSDKALSYYRKTIGADYYEFQNKGCSFIVTNSALWKSYVKDESEKHDVWFKEIIKKISLKSNPVFVIGHYPLYLKEPGEKENYFNIPLVKRSELLDLFIQNNVVAYISGHAHMTVINNYKNIRLVSGETTCNNFDNRPFGFRLWKVSSDTIKQHFVPLQNK